MLLLSANRYRLLLWGDLYKYTTSLSKFSITQTCYCLYYKAFIQGLPNMKRWTLSVREKYLATINSTYSWNETLRPLSIINGICWDGTNLSTGGKHTDVINRCLFILKLQFLLKFAQVIKTLFKCLLHKVLAYEQCAYLALGHQLSLCSRCRLHQRTSGSSDGLGCLQNLLLKVQTLVSLLFKSQANTIIIVCYTAGVLLHFSRHAGWKKSTMPSGCMTDDDRNENDFGACFI